MRIATFNVNSIKARLEACLAWLDETSPDVVALQELKCVDEAFPREPFEERGYNVETHGQKTYNGVALLSKRPLEDVERGLAGDPDDEQARWISATTSGPGDGVMRIAGFYLPNGNPAPGPKYDYKLSWMARAETRLRDMLAEETPLVALGDWNVIPEARDCKDPKAWADDALYLPQTRAAFRRIVNLGFEEGVRACTRDAGVYSFWDYQAGAWPRDNGIRIDHLLLSPQAADLLRAAGVDRQVRDGDRPSDHVPVWCEFAA